MNHLWLWYDDDKTSVSSPDGTRRAETRSARRALQQGNPFTGTPGKGIVTMSTNDPQHPGYQPSTPLASQPYPGFQGNWPRKPKRKLRYVVLGGLSLFLLVITIAIAAGGSKSHKDSSSSPAKSPGVSKGLGANDASADVKLTSCGTHEMDSSGLIGDGKITIRNHSSKRSDYFVTVTYYAKDGAQVGDGMGSAMNVESHAAARAEVVATVSGAWATCKLTEVQRTASV